MSASQVKLSWDYSLKIYILSRRSLWIKKPTLPRGFLMSVLIPNADITQASNNVRQVPIADIARRLAKVRFTSEAEISCVALQ